MSLFSNLKTDGLEDSKDVSASLYGPVESAIYMGTVKVAYAGQSTGGAASVTLLLDLDGKEYRETIYITNRKGENFFLKDGKKIPLPGFTVIDDLCLVGSGAPLCDQETEDKMVKVWDNDAKKELPKSVPVLTALTGQTVSVGIIKSQENKKEKVGDSYVPTTEVRMVNNIDKVFDTESKMTVSEGRNNAKEAVYWGNWEKSHTGVTRDKRTVKDGEAPQTNRPAQRNVSAPTAAPVAGASQAPRKSLFGPK